MDAAYMDAVYIHTPSSDLPAAFAYAPNLSPAVKLTYEVGAAAQDPATAPALAHLLASGAAEDLDAATLSNVWGQLVSSGTTSTEAMSSAPLMRYRKSTIKPPLKMACPSNPPRTPVISAS